MTAAGGVFDKRGLPSEAPQARFHYTWLARRQNESPAFEQRTQVFGTVCNPAIGFVKAELRQVYSH